MHHKGTIDMARVARAKLDLDGLVREERTLEVATSRALVVDFPKLGVDETCTSHHSAN